MCIRDSFYPDSPKNYQISQYDQPLCRGGFVEIELPGPARNIMGEHRTIALTRIHLEEDVGKLNHGEGVSLVDFNRAGTPLMAVSYTHLSQPQKSNRLDRLFRTQGPWMDIVPSGGMAASI